MDNKDDFIKAERKDAIGWARGLLDTDPASWVILDTETTGLNTDDEIVQVGVVDGAGNVLVDNQLISPTCKIKSEASAIHGITLDKLNGSPSFADYWTKLGAVLDGKKIVIYNADYDIRMLYQSGRASNLSMMGHLTAECAMLKYAAWVGDWNDYHSSFRWQRLPAGDHSAVGDCLAVLKLIKQMAEGE